MLDRAIAALPAIDAFLQQRKTDVAPLAQTLEELQRLPV
jgi:flagellar biosynthesis/type III secretory pathway ATPase